MTELEALETRCKNLEALVDYLFANLLDTEDRLFTVETIIGLRPLQKPKQQAKVFDMRTWPKRSH